jgi:hypothetical protein
MLRRIAFATSDCRSSTNYTNIVVLSEAKDLSSVPIANRAFLARTVVADN